MAIKRHKRGNRVYLAEYKSIRQGKKVISKFVRYIGPEDKLSTTDKLRKRVLDRLNLTSSYRAGDVRLLWAIAHDLDFIAMIDRICCGNSHIEGVSPGKLLTIWAINRVIDPESATQLERWVPTTDLPYLAGIASKECTKAAFLSTLDFICMDDRASGHVADLSAELDDALYKKWRHDHPLPPGDKETLAYDLTTVLFFGVSCPLAELGYNPERIRRRQVNLAVLVSKHDKHPIAHFVYNGSRNSASTVKNLLTRLNRMSIEQGTLIWDRGNVSKSYVNTVEAMEWKLICGVPKTSNEAKEIISMIDVPIGPDTLVRSSRAGHIYAIKAKSKLYGQERSVVVYTNRERGIKDADARNEALAVIGKELDELCDKEKDKSEKRLHSKIKSILNSWSNFIDARVSRKKEGPRIVWSYKKQELKLAERTDGKWLIISSDETRDANEAVNEYLDKDFIEKVFRVLKTQEEVEPVRHRLEHRVRAYLFVCMLAYRLLSVLQWKLKEASGHEDSWERADSLLHALGRVERVEVTFGNETKTWYLNVTKEITDTLKELGAKELLKEETRLVNSLEM
ncbi:Transposase [Candidatus Methanophagaceae archaeon]|nr:Transposase [Methanophagales archaeon]